MRGGFERARLSVAPQKPNKINSGFSRRIEYSIRERLFPQPLPVVPSGRETSVSSAPEDNRFMHCVSPLYRGRMTRMSQ
jgi:hypothetical protein